MLSIGRANLTTAAASLSALSPLNVLTRGYSVTLDQRGKAIKDIAEVKVGDTVRTKLTGGEFESTIERVELG